MAVYTLLYIIRYTFVCEYIYVSAYMYEYMRIESIYTKKCVTNVYENFK